MGRSTVYQETHRDTMKEGINDLLQGRDSSGLLCGGAGNLCLYRREVQKRMITLGLLRYIVVTLVRSFLSLQCYLR